MKMYILIRDDLPKNKQAVQGGHALAQFALDWPESFNKWNNHTIVYMKVGYDELRDLEFSLVEDYGLACSEFYEPDLGDQLTALAVLNSNESDCFGKFRLL